MTEPRTNLTDAQLKQTDALLDKMTGQVQFLRTLAGMKKLGPDDIRTHMDLLRHEYDDLSAILGADSLSRALDACHASCRAANAEIRELRQRLGQGVTAESAQSGLAKLESAFATWYGLCGFRYAKTEWTAYGLSAEITDDIEQPDEDGHGDCSFGQKDLTEKIKDKVPYAFSSGWDLRKDTFHDELLDTQTNRNNMEKLVTGAFPGSQVNGFESHQDHDRFLLRTKVFLPWTSIQAWLATVNPGNTAKSLMQARLDEMDQALSDEKWRKEIGPALAMNLQRDAETARAAIEAYQAASAVPVDDEGNITDQASVPGPDGTMRTYPRDTPFDDILRQVGKDFNCDVLHDLIPGGFAMSGPRPGAAYLVCGGCVDDFHVIAAYRSEPMAMDRADQENKRCEALGAYVEKFAFED